MQTVASVGAFREKRWSILKRKSECLPLKKNVAAVIVVIVIVAGLGYYHTYYSGQLTQSSVSPIPLTPRPSREPALTSPTQLNQSEPLPSQSSSITIVPDSSGNSNQPAPHLAIGVYSYDPLTNQSRTLSTIDWSADGVIMPGQTKNSSIVYFANEGSVPITMYVSTSKWTFKDVHGNSLNENYSRYFSLTWDYDNSAIAVGETRPVTFSLTVSASIIDVATFSFDLIVTIEYQ
jgi:hypothetical protein